MDINACPGSGKTTVLLAKLVILSKKMPLKNGQGICVLTHTNVAIEEIKNRLGEKSDILFKYPNYFGTIQSFVDKYLTIPFFKRQIGKQVSFIDDDIYLKRLEDISRKNFYPKIRRTIQWMIDKGLYTNDRPEKNFSRFVNKKVIKFIDGCIYIADNNGATLEKKGYYNELLEVKDNKLLRNGILKYKDAFILAEEYLKRFPDLIKYFSERYKYVFIDEMQDTKEYQEKIIKQLFNENQCIIQRFGDINQNIGSGENDEKCGWNLLNNNKSIRSSKRYGDNISCFISPIRVVKDCKLTGNSQRQTYNPHILIFNNNSIKAVKGKFNQIIERYELNKYKGKSIKAIGRIGVDLGENSLTIKSYFPEYNKSSKKGNFNEKVANSFLKTSNISKFYNILMDIIILILKGNNLDYTKENLIKYIEKNHGDKFIQYRANICRWFTEKENNLAIMSDIKETTLRFFKEINIDIKNDEIIENCFKIENNEVSEQITSTLQDIKQNDRDYITDINTVHGVKGETHLATLYLESKSRNSWQDYSDISNIIDYLLGKKDDVSENDKQALAIAYVAMSRATKLTCIAIHYETIKGRIKEFHDFGYNIDGCSIEDNKNISLELNKVYEIG